MSQLEIICGKATEAFVSEGEISVTATEWSNHEGVDILVREGRATLLHGSLRWEEVSLLELAIARAKV